MTWLFALLALVLIVAFGLVLSGRLPAVPQPTAQRYVARLPESPSATDIDLLRFPVALRGYRMDDVDMAISSLRNRVAELEADLSASSQQSVFPDEPFSPHGGAATS